MRALIPLVMILLQAVPAWSFEDQVVRQRVNHLIEQMKATPQPVRRLEQFEDFRDFLFDHMNTIPLPTDDAGKSEFALLNEFQASVFMIRLQQVDKPSCDRNLAKVLGSENTGATPDGSVLEPRLESTKTTLSILRALCGVR